MCNTEKKRKERFDKGIPKLKARELYNERRLAEAKIPLQEFNRSTFPGRVKTKETTYQEQWHKAMQEIVEAQGQVE
jgi:hypothetical protein